MVFYKTGLSHILTNTRLLFFSSSPSSSSIAAMRPEPHTRAFSLLYRRWQHDARRLPLFALMLLVCGELTPFAVLFLPRVVPFTCRIPSQVEKVLREAEARRRAARRLVAAGGAAAGEDFARSWSGGEGRAGEKKDGKGGAARIKVVGAARATPEALAMILDLPVRSWTRKKRLWSRIHERLHFLNVDDGLLAEAGGAEALVAEELRLACADRGIDVLGRSEEELRTALGRWLHLTDERRLGVEERQKAVLWLLLSEESQWDRFEG
ncbi:322c427e-17c5-4e44-8448-911f6c5cab2d [Thermothielavioides terrestris]|nr:322c427e-17c5-4e44-8448-911f6c5cab2d [Thermothielavioides terrestris]